MAGIDAVTLEILRHRLAIINEEQALVAVRTSGSPIVYEAYDLNSALLTPDGDALFVGGFTTRLALCLHMATKYVIEHLSDNPGISDGDMFYTSDPWAGAIHVNDSLMVAPIFWQGEVQCWAGLSMHEVDVGGPVPGGYGMGATDIYGESPIIAPVKLVEQGQLRKDIEAWILRNTRTPDLNAMNIRARMAAINRVKERIYEIIQDYGTDTLLEAQRAIKESVGRAFHRRLEELPDGTWREEGWLDHDGIRNRMYRVRLTLTKKADHLTFDCRGTDQQAPAMVNCTRMGLEGGIMSAVLPTMCYDMPWSPGSIQDAITILSDEGTLVHVKHPGGVGQGATGSIYVAGHLACSAISKMYAASKAYRNEVQAMWAPSWKGEVIAGANNRGEFFTTNLIDQSGGAGARAYKDGMNSGGIYGSPRQAIANVELYEQLYPIMYVYRKHCPDTAGPGKYRGGVGMETMIVPHKTGGPLDLVTLGHGATHPESKGLYGGYPSTVQPTLLLRRTNLGELFANQRIPASHSEIQSAKVEVFPSKKRTLLHSQDVLVSVNSGGGGYGDPLDRDPALVQKDVAMGLCSIDAAQSLYGVVLDSATLDALVEETDMERRHVRQQRLREGKPVSKSRNGPEGPLSNPYAGEELMRIADCLLVVSGPAGAYFVCNRCDHALGRANVDPKRYALVRTREIGDVSPFNRYALSRQMVIKEFCCPQCGALIGTQVRKKRDPVLWDTLIELD